MATNEGPRTRAARATKATKTAKAGTRRTEGEHRGSDSVRTALLEGTTFATKAVQYSAIDGMAIFEGDICLGSIEEVDAVTDQRRRAAMVGAERGVAISGANFRWPNATIPYEIEGGMPDQARVTGAIAHWETNTPIRFVLRTAANASQYPDFVHFFSGDGCWSQVGKRGGRQDLSLGSGCSLGNAIHEIGHTVGLWHEQSREDRDTFCTIHWENIQSGREHNFDQHIADGDDIGAYDYASIMHYPRTAFSKNGQDTIVPVDPAAQIGQRDGLSAGDIAAVRAMYPTTVNFKKVVDDPRPQFKKLVDDGPLRPKSTFDRPTAFKKLRDDPIKTKVSDDPIVKRKVFDDVKMPALDLGGIHGRIPGPDPSPFVMVTPHHAAVGGAGDPSSYVEQLADTVSAIGEQLAVLQQAFEQVVAELSAAFEG